jgi:site-specific recombinase XerD
MTDRQFLKLWLKNRPSGTSISYQRIGTDFLNRVGMPLKTVSASDVFSYLDASPTLNSGGRSTTLAVLKALMTFAEVHGHIRSSPLRHVKNPKPKPVNPNRIITPEDVSRVIGFATSQRDRLILRLYYIAGLRRAELTNLHRRDMLLDAGVSRSLRVIGKGDRPRIVPVSPELWSDIDAFASRDPHAPIFPGRDGRQISTMTAWRIVKRAGMEAGLPEGFSPVWLRHCHVTHRLDSGDDIRSIKSDVGHLSFSGTGYYVHDDGTKTASAFLAA